MQSTHGINTSIDLNNALMKHILPQMKALNEKNKIFYQHVINKIKNPGVRFIDSAPPPAAKQIEASNHINSCTVIKHVEVSTTDNNSLKRSNLFVLYKPRLKKSLI